MRYIIIFFSLFFLHISFAQNQPAAYSKQNEMRVGLVLSGGGAKGFAHIGVLKALEEHNVRVDYIAGTSMGAIVGGLYAAGYSAHELDSIIRKTDFTTLIQDLIPRGAQTFYERNESDRYAISLPFDNFKLGFPSGLSRGQNVYNLLSRLTEHVSHIEDFSNLPIPFLCIGTDIETMGEVVLDKGSLATAIAASGALPSLFSPKIVDGDLLVDGGVVNNFPIEHIISEVDVVIGVDVQDEFKSKDDIKSILDILTQLSSYTTGRGMDMKRQMVDVYITPDIDAFSVVSFEEAENIIRAGERAAEEVSPDLKFIASRQIKKPVSHPPIVLKDSIKFSEIKISGLRNYTRSYVLGKLKIDSGEKMSYEEFDSGVYNLLSTRNFAAINYGFLDGKEDAYTLNLQLRESPNKQYLRFAAHYDDIYKTAILLNYTHKQLLLSNDIFSLDFIVGDNLRYNLDYYVDKGKYWSYGFNSHYDASDIVVGADILKPEYEEVDETIPSVNTFGVAHKIWTNRLYFETIIKRNFQVGLGAQHRWMRISSSTLSNPEQDNKSTNFYNSNLYSGIAYLKYDTFDGSFYPTKGFLMDASFEQVGFSTSKKVDHSTFSVVKGQVYYTLPIVEDKLSLTLGSEIGFHLGQQTTRVLDFFLGGHGFVSSFNTVQFIGQKALQQRGNSFLKAAARLSYQVFPKNFISLGSNIANIQDDLFEGGAWHKDVDHSSFFIGYGVKTFFGPIDLKYAYDTQYKESNVYVVVGYPF